MDLKVLANTYLLEPGGQVLLPNFLPVHGLSLRMFLVAF